MVLKILKSKFYANKRICNSVPLLFQTECLIAFVNVLKEIKEDYPDVTLSELFNADE